MNVIAKRRVYRNPDGKLTERPKSGASLFCSKGRELSGSDAEEYQSKFGEKGSKPAEDKGSAPAEDKAVGKAAGGKAEGE